MSRWKTGGSAARTGLSAIEHNTMLVLAIAILVAALRVYYCGELPVNTGDTIRHMLYGQAVLERGLSAMSLSPREISPAYANVAWSYVPYRYPPVTLFFFTATSWLGLSLYGVKLLLTLVEALGAVTVFRITQSRALALLYWAMPVSIWWVSHEGQIEPLQALLSLLAILLLKRERHFAAWAILALAIQTKLSAVLLVPYFLVRSRKSVRASLSGLLVGCVPSLAVQSQYDVLRLGLLYGVSMMKGAVPYLYNPYWFNAFDKTYWAWHPTWLIVWLHVTTPLAMLYFLHVAYRERADYQRWIAVIPVVLFLVTLQVVKQGQFWYIALLPSLMMTIDTRKVLFAGFALTLLLDPVSVTEMLWRPWGYTVGDYYRINAFLIR